MACAMLTQECNPEANIIWGVAFDSELEDEIRITIIATSFADENATAAAAADEKDAQAEEKKPVSEWDGFLDDMFGN